MNKRKRWFVYFVLLLSVVQILFLYNHKFFRTERGKRFLGESVIKKVVIDGIGKNDRVGAGGRYNQTYYYSVTNVCSDIGLNNLLITTPFILHGEERYESSLDNLVVEENFNLGKTLFTFKKQRSKCSLSSNKIISNDCYFEGTSFIIDQSEEYNGHIGHFSESIFKLPTIQKMENYNIDRIYVSNPSQCSRTEWQRGIIHSSFDTELMTLTSRCDFKCKTSCFEKVVFPSPLASFNNVFDAETIRENAWNLCKVKDEKRNGKMVITIFYRSDKRRIKNLESVMKYLEREIDLNLFHLQKHEVDGNYCSQVKIFYYTDIAISIHGSVLINQVFMKPFSVVIEIFPPFFYNERMKITSTYTKTNYLNLMLRDIELVDFTLLGKVLINPKYLSDFSTVWRDYWWYLKYIKSVTIPAGDLFITLQKGIDVLYDKKFRESEYSVCYNMGYRKFNKAKLGSPGKHQANYFFCEAEMFWNEDFKYKGSKLRSLFE